MIRIKVTVSSMLFSQITKPSIFTKEMRELKFRPRFFFHSATVCKSLTHMHENLTLMSTWHGVMADEEKFMLWKISRNTVYNMFKMDTKYSQHFW